MRSLTIILILIISTIFAQSQADSVGFFVKIGDPSPEFALTFPNGDSTLWRFANFAMILGI